MIDTPFIRMLSAKGWSMTKFARTIGVSTNTLYPWLRGEKMPQDRHIDKIAEVLEENPRRIRAVLEAGMPAEEAPEETKAEPDPPTEPAPKATEEPKLAEPVPESVAEPEPDEVTLEAAETPEPTLPWTKTVTNEDYLNAANMAVRALKEVIGTDSKTVMLAVMFVTAEIQNRLFI